jgi:hypothetical protein
MNEQMGWGRALILGILIVALLLGFLAVGYFAFEEIIMRS